MYADLVNESDSFCNSVVPRNKSLETFGTTIRIVCNQCSTDRLLALTAEELFGERILGPACGPGEQGTAAVG